MAREFHITTVYGTTWRAEHAGTEAGSLAAHLPFGPLASYYGTSTDQFPEVRAARPIEVETAQFHRWRGGRLTCGQLRLFVLPSEQVVVGLTLQVDSALPEVADLLADCHDQQVRFADTEVAAWAVAVAQSCGIQVDQAEFTPERHQLVFAADLPTDDPKEAVPRLSYRSDLDYRPEFSHLTYPAELNRHRHAMVAVGPYLSILFGQPEYVASCAVVSATQAVASAVRLRELRHALYHILREFQAVEHSPDDTRSRRLVLEGITGELTRLELDLSVAVETPVDLGMLVPSPRVVEYHLQLYRSIGVGKPAENVSRMLRRLEATGRAALTAVESVERRVDEDRHLRWAVAVGFISVVAIPPSLILAFFGGSAAEVDATRSMLHPSYWWLYLMVGLIILIAVGLGLTLYAIQRRRNAAQRAAWRVTQSAART